MHVLDYLSSLRWLLKSFKLLVHGVENWRTVLLFYSIPEPFGRILQINFRNGLKLKVPNNYIFEPISETLLQNVYGFKNLRFRAVIVDVGASIGDFVLLASRSPGSRIYAFEPDPYIFMFLRENVGAYPADSMQIFNSQLDHDTLRRILEDSGEPMIDFLKIDCDGCEYDLLLSCPIEVLSKISTIAMEIHTSKSHKKKELVACLKAVGFTVVERLRRGEGHYLYATQTGERVQSLH